MVDHAARDHATWSASSTERNWACAGALALTIDLPEKTSEAADWGTCAHEIAEICLRKGVQADNFIGETRKGKMHSFEVDEEMAETAQEFVDYVRQTAIAAAPKNTNPADLIQIEQKFSLAAMNPPFEAGGTADAVIYKPLTKELEVVDLKGGRGHVVEVKGNPQLRTYALGAMLANKGLAVEKVTVTIVQPRAPHKDGRTRSETFHVADLVEWTGDLMEAMRRSADAFADRQGDKSLGLPMPMATWAEKHLAAGPWCKFCKAAGTCPALEQKAFDAAGVWFDDLDQPRLTNMPDADDPAKIARDLDALDMIEDWIKARRARAHELAEQGVEIPNYILVPKTGREKWAEDAEAKAAAIAKQAGIPDEKVFNAPKIRTPKQVRDALAKAKADAALREIKELSFTPENGSNLVRASKTTRSAIPPAAHKHFDILD
jgi:hypothetical protein